MADKVPKPDGGPFPCSCAEKGDYCLLDSMNGDTSQMWEEYHCINRVIGVIYKRDDQGKIVKQTTVKPSSRPIQKRLMRSAP